MKIGYIPSLDGIRAFSVTLVLIAHGGLGHIVPGGLGVTIFFFLSGYLITTLLREEYYSSGKIHFPHFYARRFLRLYPPLIIVLSLAYILVMLGVLEGGHSIYGYLQQVFYLANYHEIFNWPGAVPRGSGVLWSLAVEEHFYLVFPLLLSLLLASVVDRRFIPVVLACLCLVVLVWRMVLVGYYEVEEIRTYYGTDTRIDSILFGCILALTRNPLDQESSKKISFKVWFCLSAAGLALLATLVVRNEFFRETLRYSIQGLALMPIFYYAVKHHQHPVFHCLNWSWIRRLGVYSYTIYLSHNIVIGYLRKYEFFSSNVVFVIVAAAAIATFIAFLIDKYVDSYFRVLRSKLR